MSGLQLSSMEASDMLDVIHVIIEDDLTSSQTGENSEVKSKMRTIFYREFYDKVYKFSTANPDFNLEEPLDMNVDDEIKPFDPKQQPTKPFVPATNFDANAAKPFGKILDAPIE
jgi:hypothetical protein